MAASKVLLQHGLAATRIADITAAAGLTQGGFYRHFGSKEQLIAQACGAASDRLLDMLETLSAGLEPRQAIERIAALYLHQRQNEDSALLCPLASLGSELRHADDDIKAISVGGYTRMVRLVAAQTQRLGIAEHSEIADAITSTLVGAVTLSRLALDPAMAETILTNAQRAVGMLLAPTPKSDIRICASAQAPFEADWSIIKL